MSLQPCKKEAAASIIATNSDTKVPAPSLPSEAGGEGWGEEASNNPEHAVEMKKRGGLASAERFYRNLLSPALSSLLRREERESRRLRLAHFQREKRPGPRKRNLWPAAIIGYFAVAIIAAIIFVAWAVRQNIDLVRDDYYAEELRFQKQMERVDRTRQLNTGASIVYNDDEQMITVALPPDHSGKSPEGSIHFYRPSDAALDLNLKLQPGTNGKQHIPTSGLQAGLWKVRLLWKVEGTEFFTDSSVIVAGKES